LDDVDLAIHEAGHFIFAPFGDHLSVLGGSLLQVLVPLIFVVYFWRSRQTFAGAITLSWVALNLVSVARYIGDARGRDLPLLGGENALHDWWYLLTEWDLLKQDHEIARTVRLLGICTFVLSVGIAWFIERADERERRTEPVSRAPRKYPFAEPRR
jgi:hypothetical protein